MPDDRFVEYDEVVRRLRAAGCVFAEDEARVLLDAVDGSADRELRLVTMVAEREEGRPLELIVGYADFAGVRVRTAPGVFVPRQRSELLVRLAAERLPQDGLLLDLGCGTGALAVAVLARRGDVRAHAVDVDPAAVAVARDNLDPGRARVHLGAGFEALPPALLGRFDLVLANLPYVPTQAIALMPPEARDHEHHVALDGGEDGVEVQREVLRDCAHWLRPGASVLVETGRDQVAATAGLLTDAGLFPTTHTDTEIGATAVEGVVTTSRD